MFKKITQMVLWLFSRIRVYHLILGGLILTGAVVLYIMDPRRIPLYIPCFFYRFTGFYCPGCGVTRALHHILHGHLKQAFGFNPLFVTGFLIVGIWILVKGICRFIGFRLPEIGLNSRLFWIVIWMAILFGVLRNIPEYPFTLLAP